MPNLWAVAFDGFGVAAVTGVVTLTYRRFIKDNVTPSQVGGSTITKSTVTGSMVAGRDINIGQMNVSPPHSTPPEVEEVYHEHPTPTEMRAEIAKVSAIYAQEAVAQTYRGLRVRWSGTL